MEEIETKEKDSIQYILDSLSEILSQRADVGHASFARSPMEKYASPEEGVRLIHPFICIKRPELRAAIIKLAVQMAEAKDEAI